MSLGIVIKAPEGLVLAAESRVTLSAQQGNGQSIHVNFDNATKLLSFSPPNTTVGVVTYGAAAIGLRTIHSFVPEFEASLPETRLSVEDFAKCFSDFLIKQWSVNMPPTYQGPDITIVVGGYDEKEPYGKVFLFNIPSSPTLTSQHANPEDFGITWGGQREFVDRLLQGYDSRLPEMLSKTMQFTPEQIKILKQILIPLGMPLPLMAMPLQDCVDLAIFFIRTTITAQNLTVGIRGCGGHIDVAIITRRGGLRFIQQKQITGETRRFEEFSSVKKEKSI